MVKHGIGDSNDSGGRFVDFAIGFQLTDTERAIRSTPLRSAIDLGLKVFSGPFAISRDFN